MFNYLGNFAGFLFNYLGNLAGFLFNYLGNQHCVSVLVVMQQFQ